MESRSNDMILANSCTFPKPYLKEIIMWMNQQLSRFTVTFKIWWYSHIVDKLWLADGWLSGDDSRFTPKIWQFPWGYWSSGYVTEIYNQLDIV
jgi:hypothetical protein